MRLTNVLTYSLSSLLLTLAACGDGDSGTPARFSSATELQRQRALIAGTGMDAAFGFLIGSFLTATPAESTCPRIAQSGLTTTATFDCTDDSGQRIDGTVILTNVASVFGGGPETDPTKDSSVVFQGYHAHDPDPTQELAFDGRIVLHPDQNLVVELDAQLNGLAVVTDATFTSADGDLTTAVAGSSVELEGLGRATIEGAWHATGDTASGAIELHGADVLRADFDAMVDGCIPLTIDGQSAGQLCNEQSNP